jgi:hypothetical protein
MSQSRLEAHTADADGYLSHRQILVVMSGLMAGMFLGALDQSIVGTALPTITSDLGGLDELSWVVTAYLLTATAVGQDLRPLRSPDHLPGGDPDLPSRVAALRTLPDHDPADRLPSDPGHRRWRPVRAGHGDDG